VLNIKIAPSVYLWTMLNL